MDEILEARKLKKLSLMEMADIFQVSYGKLHGWQSGKCTFNEREMKKIAEFCNIPIERLQQMKEEYEKKRNEEAAKRKLGRSNLKKKFG